MIQKNHPPQFNIGDTVKLKSGSEVMTVYGYYTGRDGNMREFTDYSMVVCTWHHNNVPQYDTYPVDALIAASAYDEGLLEALKQYLEKNQVEESTPRASVGYKMNSEEG